MHSTPLTPLPLDHLAGPGRKQAEAINVRIASIHDARSRYDAFATGFRDSRPDPGADHHTLVDEALNAEIRGRFERYAICVYEAQLRRDVADHLVFVRKQALLDAAEKATKALTDHREKVRDNLERQGWKPTDGPDNPGRYTPGMVEAHPEVHAARNLVAELRAHVTETEAAAREHLAAADQLDETIAGIRAKLVAG